MATRENVKIERNMMVSPMREKELQSKAGGSNIGEYSGVANENFAGNSCGLPGAYPINTIERARSALAYAHNARDPQCIKNAVYRKWPELRPENKS